MRAPTSSTSSPYTTLFRSQAQLPAQLQGLPAATATGSVTFPEPGNGVIKAPAPTLTFTPHTSTTDLDPITCATTARSEEHTSELQSLRHVVCRLLLEKKNY